MRRQIVPSEIFDIIKSLNVQIDDDTIYRRFNFNDIPHALLKKEILKWFIEFIDPDESAMWIGNYPPTLELIVDQSDDGFILNGSIGYQGHKISSRWVDFLHGAHSFKEYVLANKDGGKLLKRAIRHLGYSKKEWDEENCKELKELFTKHGLGFEYDFSTEYDKKFQMTCEQSDWRLPKELVANVEKEVTSICQEIMLEYQFKELSVANYAGIFQIGWDFSYRVVQEL